MRLQCTLLSVGFLLILSLLPASSQETAAAMPPDPEAVTQAFLDALESEGMGATGRFFDPAALAEIKTAFLGLLELEAAKGEGELRGLLFAGDPSWEQIQALPPTDFYQAVMRFIEVQMGQVDAHVAGGKVLGTVMEGEDLAHVVTRVQVGIGDEGVSSLDVVSLRRSDTGWALLLKGEMQQMVQAIRAQVDLARAAEALEAPEAPEKQGTDEEP
jgi:hypothetical protein